MPPNPPDDALDQYVKTMLELVAHKKTAAENPGEPDPLNGQWDQMHAWLVQLQDISINGKREPLPDAQKAELVKLRYFAGLTFDEVASALDIAVPTAKQWWAYARAWLRVEIARQREAGSTHTAFP